MIKIVVLGSNGQLGSDLIKILPNPDREVIASTRANLDALGSDVMEKLEQYNNVDYIINCIATTDVDGCEDNPKQAFMLNGFFPLQLAQFCSHYKITLIHLSTDYVFDGKKTEPYLEDDKTDPLNIYGLSKSIGEIAIHHYARRYFILRVAALFGVAGASGKGGNFVTTMLRLAQEKESWNVINDQLTCPTHTLDIARAIDALITQKVSDYGIYNCVSSNSCSWFEFAQEILQKSGYDPAKVKPISYTEYKFKARRPQYAVMATDKLARYYVMSEYEHGLAEYVQLINQAKS